MTDSSHTSPPGNGATTEVITIDHADARGTVRIAPAVLIELIELTVQGVDGLRRSSPEPGASRPPMRPPARKRTTMAKSPSPIQGDHIDASMALAVHRGTNVSGLSTEIQKRIGFAVGNMLGMTVRTVDIDIEEIIPGPAPA